MEWMGWMDGDRDAGAQTGEFERSQVLPRAESLTDLRPLLVAQSQLAWGKRDRNRFAKESRPSAFRHPRDSSRDFLAEPHRLFPSGRMVCAPPNPSNLRR